MKLLVLVGLLAALLACAEGSGGIPQCPYTTPDPYCPYSSQDECGVPYKQCPPYQECCRGKCNNECRPIPKYTPPHRR
ncbi:hypothetical protein FJT64_010632 [Amphibalanus amphitrite]|uniref:WAP domain-containing protein n=1 Tax=Amphibalanus amphitrite TaxID=1232801 RepID=A0A6A4VLJ2_AMPAM|nr:hypothetical protein FJT64_010632 [Amphibalanus amphitrite]